jgi:hypothetical protein
VNDEERSAWRSQAVQWLASDLKELKLRAETAPLKPGLDFPRNFPDPSKWLSHWLQDADLAGIRDPERLKALPKAEREKFDALWRDVTTFLQTLANAPRQATDATDVDFPNP